MKYFIGLLVFLSLVSVSFSYNISTTFNGYIYICYYSRSTQIVNYGTDMVTVRWIGDLHVDRISSSGTTTNWASQSCPFIQEISLVNSLTLQESINLIMIPLVGQAKREYFIYTISLLFDTGNTSNYSNM